MKILVTGGAGFIGSHVVDRLIEEGCKVAIVDDLSTGRMENINPSAVFYRTDITDPQLAEVFDSFKPEAVIHHAAQANVSTSIADPAYDAKVNIQGTLNILECCRKFAVAKVVYASSAAIYGQPQYLPINEKHPIKPTSPYGISKYTPEQYLAVYNEIYHINYVILRYANVFGPRQDPHGEGGVVAIFTDRLLAGISPTIYGDGEQTRDFVYVKDIAQANWLALKSGENQTINISTNQPTSVNELFYKLKSFINNSSCSSKENLMKHNMLPLFEKERAGDIRDSYLDNQKAREGLGWNQSYTLEQGLEETVRFYQR